MAKLDKDAMVLNTIGLNSIRIRVPAEVQTKSEMRKVEKKKEKLKERIQFLENELVNSLTKKTSDVKEINIASHQRKIYDLKLELKKM